MLWASKSSCGRFCLSRPKQPFPHSRSLCLPCGHQTREGACAGFTCARPSARALNVQAAGQHLAGISCTHMGAHIWAMVAELVGGGPLPAHSPSLPFARLQTPSFHQAWPSAFAAPGLQCAGKGQAAMLERWRPGAWWKLPRGMCRQRAGCNPGAAKADG